MRPKSLGKYLKQVFTFWGLLCALLIPYPFHLFPYQQPIVDFLFKRVLVFIAQFVFNIHLVNPQIASDTVLLYLLVLLLLLVSIFTTAIISKVVLWKKHSNSIIAFSQLILCYYLALQLLEYGAGKICKSQFYLPEPNILYTHFGKLDKDILYWSCMGTSYSYNLFLGIMEAIAAICLFFRRLRVIGLLLAIGILINIVAINFCFDISVKLYSCFLLFLSLMLLPSQLKQLYHVLIQRANKKTIVEPIAYTYKKFKTPRAILKTIVIGLIFLEAFYPNISTKDFNDDTAKRPYLHGAYETVTILSGKDTLPFAQSPIKRFFIHRKGYIIFQDQEDALQDYHLEIDSNHHFLILTNYQLKQKKIGYSISKDSLITLHYITNGKEYTLVAKALQWQQMPALQKQFHWAIDEE